MGRGGRGISLRDKIPEDVAGVETGEWRGWFQCRAPDDVLQTSREAEKLIQHQQWQWQKNKEKGTCRGFCSKCRWEGRENSRRKNQSFSCGGTLQRTNATVYLMEGNWMVSFNKIVN